MGELAQSEKTMDSKQLENARIGYQVAIEMWSHIGDDNMARSNIMLVANSVIVAVIGVALSSQRILPAVTLILPIVGLILCGVWYIIMKRCFDYQIYYILSARELEERFLADALKTVSRGAAFAQGQEVSLQLGDRPVPLRMGFWSRTFPSQKATYIAVVAFAIAYIALLVQA